MLNATWLETFTVLAETGHFTRTAERLAMTQPGVSQHLRKLEDQVGAPLISRAGKGFTLTEAGEAVAALGRRRRAEEAALREEIAEDHPGKGTARVACSGSFAMLLYPALIDMMRAAPDLTLRLDAAPQEDVLARVLDRRADLGIVTRRPGHPRLDARKLGEEEICLVLPARAPLPDPTLAALDARGVIAHPDGGAYADALLAPNFPETYRGAGQLRVRSFVNQIGQIPAPVAAGLGYTILPRSGIDAFPGRAALTLAPLPRRHHHTLWLISGRGRERPARVDALAATIARLAGTLAPPPSS